MLRAQFYDGNTDLKKGSLSSIRFLPVEKPILLIVVLAVIVFFVLGHNGGESKEALVRDSQVIAFANLISVDMPAQAACSTSGKSAGVHYATVRLAKSADIKGDMPKTMALQYAYT